MLVRLFHSQLLFLSIFLFLRGSSAQDCSTSVPNNSVVIFDSRTFNSPDGDRIQPYAIPGWTLLNADQFVYDPMTRNVTIEWKVVTERDKCSPEYSVCPSAILLTPNSSIEQNWIITNYFLTEAINIQLRIECTSNPNAFTIDCRDAIRANYLESDQNLTHVTSRLDQFQPTSYSSSAAGVITFSFNRTKRGFFIGFLNNSPCVTITSFLFYSLIQCPAVSNSLYSLPATIAPNSAQPPLLISPTCPGNLELFPSNATAQCYANGTWMLPPLPLSCECPVDTYLEGEAVSMICGQSPSVVRNLRVERDSGVLRIVWEQPSYLGNRNVDTLSYRVCYKQSLSGVNTCEEVNVTEFKLADVVASGTEYVVAVTSLNPLSNVSGVFNTANVTFLSSFPDLTQPMYSGGYLTWNFTLYARERYQLQIRYQSVETGDSIVSNVNSSSCIIVSNSIVCSLFLPDLNTLHSITISILEPSGPLSDPISREYNFPIGPPGLTLLNIIFFIVIPISLFLFLVLIFTILCVCIIVLCNKRRFTVYKRDVESDEVLHETQTQLYQDPSQYEDLNKAVRALAKEIEPEDIEKESIIGVGEFGDVCKGYLIRNNKKVPVALKFLKPSPTVKVKDDFFKEASIMGQFSHPNVIFLYGVTLKKPIMIVTPYMDNGSLDKYLVDNVFNLALGDLIAICCGVSRGMVYLCKRGYIHRDIAARNILVDRDLTPKITDFGLSRFSEENLYKVQSGGKIPVRWTAPEAILYRKFNSASDVWSFGILMWEVMSHGQLPYGNTDNILLLEQIQNGFRLQPPDRCPSVVYNLMIKCWDEAPDNRPSFEQLEHALVQIMEINKVRPPSLNQKLGLQNPLNYTTVEAWLTSLKLERYVLNFKENGYTQMSSVWHLSEEDLFTIGIIPVGHRNKIMSSIHRANNQLCFTYSVPV